MKVNLAHGFRACWLFLLLMLALAVPKAVFAAAPDLITWDALVPPKAANSRPAEGVSQAPAELNHRSLPAMAHPQGLIAADDWLASADDVATPLLGTAVTLDGYVLPLVWDGKRVVEFLLVPWVGACIHTPAPPPNQMIHVVYAKGLLMQKQFEAVRLSGVLTHEPDAHMLFLVDGNQPVLAAYALTGAELSGQPGEVVAASALDVPALARLQIWANGLFVDSMSALDRGGSPGALIFAMALAFAYGALHTLGPGHGKSVVISYFVGTGGSLTRGLTMGARIAVFHVLSAVVVIFLFDLVVRRATGAAPSDFQAIRLASYALVIAIGVVMLWQAVQAIFERRQGNDETHHHHEHAAQHAGCRACAAAAQPRAGAGWVAASVGLVPCTGALLVMVFGLANDLILPAVIMVIAISFGMAVAMSAIGVAALWGRHWLEGRFEAGSKRRVRFEQNVRLAGASCVILIGVVLFGLTLSLPPLPQTPAGEVAFRPGPPALTDG